MVDDPSVADQLLPLVYDELRKLAAARMAQELLTAFQSGGAW